MPLAPEPALKLAMSAATEAGMYCRAMQRRLATVGREAKADGSVVTVADYAAQALLTRRLLTGGARVHAIVGEESGAALAARPELLKQVIDSLVDTGAWPGADQTQVMAMLNHAAWKIGQPVPVEYVTIDPIDGTKGFVNGRQYSVCLAWMKNERPVMAAVCCPNLSPDSAQPVEANDETGQTFGCTAESGVFVSRAEDSAAAIVPCPPRTPLLGPPRLTFSVEPGERRLEDFERISRLLGETRPPVQIDSQCKYCLIARGDADAYYRPPRRTKENVWDHAAGCLLLERAGCVVTDVRGKPMDWSYPMLNNNEGILGAPAELHARILKAVNA